MEEEADDDEEADYEKEEGRTARRERRGHDGAIVGEGGAGVCMCTGMLKTGGVEMEGEGEEEE